MEVLSHHSTAIEPTPTHVFARSRHSADVPEDVDYLLDHLNDPNFDLRKKPLPPAPGSENWEMNHKKFVYEGSDGDTESQFDRYSSSEAESRSSCIDFDDESPYPEVRAAVASIDDPTMPVNTFRMWFIGIFFSVLSSGMNQVFAMRYPSVMITAIVIQLISLPFGKGLERILPTTRFNTFGYVWSFNPGPFTVKEHVCITVMANIALGGGFATDIILAQKIFYHQRISWIYQVLLTVSTQTLGFSVGGMIRQFVVWPSSMIWPGALVNAALFNTLHKNYGRRERGHWTRERFFFVAAASSFAWYWVPGYLFTGLSVFNWVCWIAPNNVVVNTLFGTSSGLGMSILTFDWSQIAFLGSPLVTPWWSELNIVGSFLILLWIAAPIAYFTNALNFAYFPLSSGSIWDNTGAPYNASGVVGPDGIFDQQAYANYSPVFLPTTMYFAYCIGFAAFTSILVHTFLWFRRDIARRFKNSLRDERDVHSRLMQAYPEVPMWWFGAVLAVCFVFLCVAVEIGKTQLPIWATVVAVVVSAIFALPVAMLTAITNQQVGLHIMDEMIGSYLVPGRPIAVVIFKTIVHMGTSQAVAFAGDMKLGHYMKIPPRIMFSVQTVGSVIGCIVITFVQDWMLANVTDICTPHQSNGFTCAASNTFASSILIWGGVGPQRLFGPGAPYSSALWFFFIGAIVPIPFYFLARRFPLSLWRYINIPVAFAGLQGIPPATGINYASWVMTGFVFNYWIRRYHFRWWMRYNYILSAAIDAGVAIASFLIFFCLSYPKGGINLSWWGNDFWMTTADALGTPFYTVSPNTIIGPQTWS